MVGNVCVIGDALLLCAHIGRFFDGLALAGETCLADEQIFCIQNADVGGNHIPSGWAAEPLAGAGAQLTVARPWMKTERRHVKITKITIDKNKEMYYP